MKKLSNILQNNPIAWFIQWIRPSFEGSDGKASGKRFTTFFFAILVGYFVYADKITTWFSFYAFCAVLASVLLMWGIITIQNLTEFIRLLKNGNSKEKEE